MRGFFGFVLVFAMLIMLLGLAATENNFYCRLGEAGALMIEAEQASKERGLMDSSLDKIVAAKLGEQIAEENFEAGTVKEEVNRALADYFAGKADATTSLFEFLGEPNEEFLNENSEAFLIEKDGITYAEYVFTGGLFRNRTVSGKPGGQAVARFFVPAGYTVRVVG